MLKVEALSQKNRADHTNNLYELVKEQLKKSEEKFVEFSKYGDGLLQKNSTLQERVVSLEDQVALWIAPEHFKVSISVSFCLSYIPHNQNINYSIVCRNWKTKLIR